VRRADVVRRAIRQPRAAGFVLAAFVVSAPAGISVIATFTGSRTA